MSKYNAKKVVIDGITFDSRAEGAYYQRLLKLKKSGVVDDFEMQKTYTLLDKFTHPESGKTVRAIKYVADFEVCYTDGRVEVVDIKGMLTPVFRIKEKLFLYRYRIPLVLLKYKARQNEFVEL